MAKEYKELTFTDNFMFCKVITHNPDLCRHMLELILGKTIRRVEIKAAEKVMAITPEAKSIRLDVYLDDEEGTVYDLEMQTYENKNLPRRLRYYQGVIDLNLIEKGDDYDTLPESVIVFICAFDYFGKKLPFYVFENRCEALPELLLGDGARKIFVNPYGDRKGLVEDVAHFLDYIKDNRAADEFTRELEQAVEKARTHKEWEVEYMNWRAYEMDVNIAKRKAREEGWKEGQREGWKEGQREGQKEGQKEGRKEGDLSRSRQSIFDLLEDLGEIPADICSRVNAEEDTELLRVWHKAAARAGSFEDFRECMR